MSKHSHISAIFDNAIQSRAGSPDVYMSMGAVLNLNVGFTGSRKSSRGRKKIARGGATHASGNLAKSERAGVEDVIVTGEGTTDC